MSRTDDIIASNEKPQWEVPVNPEGDAAYWRARAEKAEAKLAILEQWEPFLNAHGLTLYPKQEGEE